MPKLKLGTLLDDKPVRLTLELPAEVHRDLVAYAQIMGRDTGQAVEPAKLVAPMLAKFMAADRAFAKAGERPLRGAPEPGRRRLGRAARPVGRSLARPPSQHVRQADELAKRRVGVLRRPCGVEGDDVRRARKRAEDHSRDGQGRACFTGEADAEAHGDQVQQAVAAYRDALYRGPVAKTHHVVDNMVVDLGPAFRLGGEEALSLQIGPADLGVICESVAGR